MGMHSAVKLAGVLALTAVVTTACASVRQDQAAAIAEQAKIMGDASIDGARKRADYLKCVLDDANTYAMDSARDAMAPGDLADVSLAKCGSFLKDAHEDFSLEQLSEGDDVVHAAAAAARTADVVRSSARGQAVALIVDARRRRSSTLAKEAGS